MIYRNGDWYFTTLDVAVILGTNDSRVRQMIYDQQFDSYKQGRDHIIHPDDLAGTPVYAPGRPRRDGTRRVRGYVMQLSANTTLPCPDCGTQMTVEQMLERGDTRCTNCGERLRLYSNAPMISRGERTSQKS